MVTVPIQAVTAQKNSEGQIVQKTLRLSSSQVVRIYGSQKLI